MQTRYKDHGSLISSETNIQLLLFVWGDIPVLKTELLDIGWTFQSWCRWKNCPSFSGWKMNSECGRHGVWTNNFQFLVVGMFHPPTYLAELLKLNRHKITLLNQSQSKKMFSFSFGKKCDTAQFEYVPMSLFLISLFPKKVIETKLTWIW